jgi:hypothetical protein
VTEPGGRRRARIPKMFVPCADPQAAITNALASCEVPDEVLVVDWFEELFTAGEAVAARAGHRPPPDGTHASMSFFAGGDGVVGDVLCRQSVRGR